MFQTAAIARSDPSGRAIVLVPAVFALSSMVGPGLAGYLVADGSFLALLGAALASTLVPLGVYALWSPASPAAAARPLAAGA